MLYGSSNIVERLDLSNIDKYFKQKQSRTIISWYEYGIQRFGKILATHCNSCFVAAYLGFDKSGNIVLDTEAQILDKDVLLVGHKYHSELTWKYYSETDK